MPTPFPCGVAGFRWRVLGRGLQVLVRLADWKVVATLRRVDGQRLWRCNDGKAVLVAVARVQAEQAAQESVDQPCKHCGASPSFTINQGRPEPTCDCVQ